MKKNSTHLKNYKKRIIFHRDNGLSPLSIAKALYKGNKIGINWPQFSGREIIFSHLGRAGLFLSWHFLRLKPGDEVLMPSYNCGSEVDPFLFCGAKVILYRVDEHANIDIDDLKKKITKKTRVFYITYYFGWPHAEEIIEFCRSRNLIVIEDCALALFCEDNLGPLGKRGDFAIHSFRKSLSIPAGAALVYKKKDYYYNYNLVSPSFKNFLNETARYLVRWGIIQLQRVTNLNNMMKSPVEFNEIQEPYKDYKTRMNDTYFFREEISNLAITRLSKGVLNQTNPADVKEVRRRNYIQLFNGLKSIKGIKFLYDNLPEGVCPLFLPIFVSKPKKWVRELNKMGVYANRWWEGFHPNLNWGDFPESCALKNNLVTLPVHQYLSVEDVEYIINSVNEISEN